MYIPCATQSSWCAIVCVCTCTYHRLLFIKARIVHSDIRPECCGFVVMQGVLLKVLTRFDPSQRPERATRDVARELRAGVSFLRSLLDEDVKDVRELAGATSNSPFGGCVVATATHHSA